jgi:hypothetical protein
MEHCNCSLVKIDAIYNLRDLPRILIDQEQKTCTWTEADLFKYFSANNGLLQVVRRKDFTIFLQGEMSHFKLLIDIAEEQNHLRVVLEGQLLDSNNYYKIKNIKVSNVAIEQFLSSFNPIQIIDGAN